MKPFLIFLIMVFLAASSNAQLERGIKGDMEDVILVGADDWHGPIVATPLAIWSGDQGVITKPLMILPKNVSSGTRLGWVEQKDLDRYGAAPVLQTLESGNITEIIIHGSGDLVKDLVERAQKDGMKAYVTATLEPPNIGESEIDDALPDLRLVGGRQLSTQHLDIPHIGGNAGGHVGDHQLDAFGRIGSGPGRRKLCTSPGSSYSALR